MRDRLPLLLALLVVGVVSIGVAVRSRRGTPAAATAETVVARALAAASAGDVEGYLWCFAEPLRSALERAVDEAGREAYGESLKQRGKAMTGWAVTRLPAAADDREVRLRVDVVYRDRNEIQDYAVCSDGASWRIARLGPPAAVRMPVAYGTAVGSEAAAGTGTRSGKAAP